MYINADRLDEASAPLREAEALYRSLVQSDSRHQEMLTDTLSLLSQSSAATDVPRDRISVLEELLPGLRAEGHISEVEREEGVTMSKAGARDRLCKVLKELAELYKQDGQPEKSKALWDGDLGILMTESLRVRRN